MSHVIAFAAGIVVGVVIGLQLVYRQEPSYE
jgi:F0F1-type ATP synthase assembly protein I